LGGIRAESLFFGATISRASKRGLRTYQVSMAKWMEAGARHGDGLA